MCLIRRVLYIIFCSAKSTFHTCAWRAHLKRLVRDTLKCYLISTAVEGRVEPSLVLLTSSVSLKRFPGKLLNFKTSSSVTENITARGVCRVCAISTTVLHISTRYLKRCNIVVIDFVFPFETTNKYV